MLTLKRSLKNKMLHSIRVTLPKFHTQNESPLTSYFAQKEFHLQGGFTKASI